MKKIALFTILLFFTSCEPWVDVFEDDITLEIIMFESSDIGEDITVNFDSLKVVSWNIRNGFGRFPWIYDSCGDSVISDESSIKNVLSKIAKKLDEIGADVVLLQEVDFLSKRSAYINQVQYLLDNTSLNFGAYASMYKTDFAPSDGLGMVDGGNVVLSKYKLEDAQRISLALRTDQGSLEQYFYLRRNILKVKIPELSQNGKDFYAVNVHATAFATDDTKQKHIDKYIEILNEINSSGDLFVSGGDLNSVPPGSEIDFCEADRCEGEICDGDYKNNSAYYGTYFGHFEGEPDLLVPLYNNYTAAIDLEDANLPFHFTHAKSTSFETDSVKFDRKLDYLFTNSDWHNGQTHQESWILSDHTAVSAIFKVTAE